MISHIPMGVLSEPMIAGEQVRLEIAARRSCNRHWDCDAADEKARTDGSKNYWGDPVYRTASHCHDECCEDCFGY